MVTFYYKAYDQLGNKRHGKIAVHTVLDARRILREKGLNSYFLEDFRVVQKTLRKRRKRQRILFGVGAFVIALALLGSGLYIGYAGRTQALTVDQYRSAGIMRGGSGTIVAQTEEGELFAAKIREAWQSFAPGVVTGIEVRKQFMTVHVGRDVRDLDQSDLEYLAVNSVKALQREFDSLGATILILEDDLTILEIRYNPFNQSTNVTHYR